MSSPQAVKALIESQKRNPTLIPVGTGIAEYHSLMARTDVPISTTPTIEVQWVAFEMSNPQLDWSLAPSKVAATWLRRLRMRKTWRDKFWTDTWPFYIQSRLSLELKADSPAAVGSRRAKSGLGKSDDDTQESIGRMIGDK